MGASISQSGEQLIRALRSPERDLVLGRRYALYIIALATEVDDAAIKWLIKYGRSIDSLVGHAVVFITFYNDVKINNPSKLYSELLDEQIYIDPFSTRQIYGLRAEPEDFDLSDIAVEYTGYAIGDETFASSMTYESDSIARYLGIPASELPCLLLIDDPRSTEFYILPMDNNDDQLFSTLRQIVGDFYAQVKYKPFFDKLALWKETQLSFIAAKLKQKKIQSEIETTKRDLPKAHLRIDELLNSADQETALRAMKKWLHGIYGDNIPDQVKLNTAMVIVSSKG